MEQWRMWVMLNFSIMTESPSPLKSFSSTQGVVWPRFAVAMLKDELGRYRGERRG